MDPISLGLVTLRSLALLLSLQGRTSEASTLSALASAAESGADVDAHMKEVAEKLKAGGAVDWNDVTARIQNSSARLHAD